MILRNASILDLSQNVTFVETGMRRNAMEVKTQLSKIGQELEIMMNKVSFVMVLIWFDVVKF